MAENVASADLILYDWLSVTVPLGGPYLENMGLNSDDFNEMAAFSAVASLLELPPECAWEVTAGVHGFARRYWFDGINIHIPRPSDTAVVWLEMSGTGCRAFETYGSGDWDFLLSWSLENGKITRLDVAFDERSGILDIRQLFIDYMFERAYVSKARTHSVTASWKDSAESKNWAGQASFMSDDGIGACLYCGSPQSDTMIRIYDKAEQLGKSGHWVRVELQLRGVRAREFLQMPEPLGQRFSGVVANLLRFVDISSTDSNRWRAPTKEYWSRFLNGAAAIRWPKKPGVVYNMARLQQWLKSQVGNSLFCFLLVYGADSLREFVESTRPAKIPDKYITIAVEELQRSYRGYLSRMESALARGDVGEFDAIVNSADFQRIHGYWQSNFEDLPVGIAEQIRNSPAYVKMVTASCGGGMV